MFIGICPKIGFGQFLCGISLPHKQSYVNSILYFFIIRNEPFVQKKDTLCCKDVFHVNVE